MYGTCTCTHFQPCQNRQMIPFWERNVLLQHLTDQTTPEQEKNKHMCTTPFFFNVSSTNSLSHLFFLVSSSSMGGSKMSDRSSDPLSGLLGTWPATTPESMAVVMIQVKYKCTCVRTTVSTYAAMKIYAQNVSKCWTVDQPLLNISDKGTKWKFLGTCTMHNTTLIIIQIQIYMCM